MPSSHTSLIRTGGGAAAHFVPAGGTIHAAPGASGHATSQVPLPPADMPVLWAGPILRRVEPGVVWVWFAASAPITALGLLYDGAAPLERTASNQLGRGGVTTSLRLGRHLYVMEVAIRALPRGTVPMGGSAEEQAEVRRRRQQQASYPRGRTLLYDLTFFAPAGMLFSDARGLLNQAAICYRNIDLPSFVLPDVRRQESHLIHASCRKLHGIGRDATRELDRHLQQNHQNVHTRPQALLLTGDQIYADDVDAGLRRGISTASEALLGYKERMPDGRFVEDVRHRSQLRQARARVGLEQQAQSLDHVSGSQTPPNGLTVDDEVGNDHLYGFGEFAAMYLLSWSPTLWDYPPVRRTMAGAARSRSYEDAQAAQRIMANIPCYMMMDDHEVSDDWPMDNTQIDRVNASQLGRWIIANGIASCWAFQLRGNHSATPPSSFAMPLQRYLAMGEAMPRQPSVTQSNLLSTERRNYVAAVLRARDYSFVAPTHPPVLFLDTRTQRSFTATGAPGLMNAAALRRMRRRIRGMAIPRGAPLMLVSPAPVIANRAFDQVQSLGSHTGSGGRYFADREGWGHNELALRDLLRSLASGGRSQVVILSGDVHFGYTAEGRFARPNTMGRIIGSRARGGLGIVQLTSSGLRNRPSGPSLAALRRASPRAGNPVVGSFDRESRDLEYWLHSMGSHELFTYNNFGVAQLDWSNRSQLVIVHSLQGEGQSGGCRVALDHS